MGIAEEVFRNQQQVGHNTILQRRNIRTHHVSKDDLEVVVDERALDVAFQKFNVRHRVFQVALGIEFKFVTIGNMIDLGVFVEPCHQLVTHLIQSSWCGVRGNGGCDVDGRQHTRILCANNGKHGVEFNTRYTVTTPVPKLLDVGRTVVHPSFRIVCIHNEILCNGQAIGNHPLLQIRMILRNPVTNGELQIVVQHLIGHRSVDKFNVHHRIGKVTLRLKFKIITPNNLTDLGVFIKILNDPVLQLVQRKHRQSNVFRDTNQLILMWCQCRCFYNLRKRLGFHHSGTSPTWLCRSRRGCPKYF